MADKRYYSVSEVIEQLGIARGTLYNWEREGKLPKPKREPLSRNRYYTKADLEELIKIFGTGRGQQ